LNHQIRRTGSGGRLRNQYRICQIAGDRHRHHRDQTWNRSSARGRGWCGHAHRHRHGGSARGH
jgi:hypothetical protein